MKSTVLMLTLIFNIIVLVAAFTEIADSENKSISIKNLSENNLSKPSSRIQKRSILALLGLKTRYRPIQISVNLRKSNQQRLTKNNNNNNQRWNNQRINTRPSTLHIQKNIFIYNGINQQTNKQNYPAMKLSTTLRPYTSTVKVVGTKPPVRMEEMFSESSMQQTESRFTTTRLPISTQATRPGKDQSTQNVGSSMTTNFYQTTPFTTSTTSIPRTERPVKINVVPTTETTLNMITNDSNTSRNMRGGFTSTSMPDKNQFSELIYDIDPRYRIR